MIFTIGRYSISIIIYTNYRERQGKTGHLISDHNISCHESNMYEKKRGNSSIANT